MSALLLNRSEVERLLDPAALAPALRTAFVAYSTEPGVRAQRARSSLPGPGTTVIIFPGTTPGTGRRTAKEVTVYGGVGLAFQDVVAAWQVYQAARARGIGRAMDFLA